MSYFKNIKEEKTEEDGRNVRKLIYNALLDLESQLEEISSIEDDMYPPEPILNDKIRHLIYQLDNDLNQLYNAVYDEERRVINIK
jgi:hypothetical protein